MYNNEFKEMISQIIPSESIDFDKLYEEIITFFSEPMKNYIKRRHKQLKKEGYKNSNIYQLISKEVKSRLFKGKDLSPRQIKRIVYDE